MEANAQLNARMSRSLKASGDEALALIGLSPTQAVRALWEKASRRGKDLEDVAKLLCETPSRDAQEEGSEDGVVPAGWTLVEDSLAARGFSYRPVECVPDEEMLEQSLEERLAERGLI